MTDSDGHNGLEQSVGDVVELQVNLDDVTGEVVGDAMERLICGGALDVWTVGIGMKKGRPGVMLCLLCEAGCEKEFAKLVIELTGSFGVRYRKWERVVLERGYEDVQTGYGSVRVKVGKLDGVVCVVSPEYEDVRKLAEEVGVSVRRVMDGARAGGAKLFEKLMGGE